MRLCRTIGGEEFCDEQVLALPSPDERKFDACVIPANQRLQKYIMTRLAREPRAWGPPNSAQQARATAILVAYKNAWARDMREWGTPDPQTGEIPPPTPAEEEAAWNDCMQRAEQDIAELQREAAA
jgi:hypothetical protein